MDERWVDVSHEALIRAWPRLRKWIDEDRAGLRLHRQISEAAEGWQRLNRDDGALFRGARLAQGLEWREHHDAELNALERQFLDASQALRDHEVLAQERRRRRQMLTMGTATAIAVLALLLIATLWQRARTQERNATARATVTAADLSRNRAGVTARGWPDALQQSVLLAIEGRRLLQTPETEQSLRAGVDLLGRSTTTIAVGGIPIVSPDGAWLVAIAEDSPVIQLVDVRARRSGMRIETDAVVRGIVFSTSSRWLAIVTEGESSDSQRLEVRTVPDGQRLWAATIDDLQGLLSPVVFSPDDSSLAVIAGSHVRVLDVLTGSERMQIDHKDVIVSVAFSVDGSRLATGSHDRTARVTVLATRAATTIRHEEEINLVALSPDTDVLLTTSAGMVDLWDLPSGRHLATVPALSGGEYIFFATFSADGGSFALIGEHGAAQLRSVRTRTLLWQLSYHGDNERLGSAISKYLGIKTPPGIEVWDVTTGKVATRVLHRDDVDKLGAFAFDAASGDLVLADGERLWIYDTNPGSEVTGASFEGPGWTIVRSPDERLVAMIAGQAVAIWDVERAQVVTRFTAAQSIANASFSVDRRHLIATSKDANVEVWDLTQSRSVWAGQHIVRAVLNGDGTLLASAAYDQSVRMWAIPGGRELWRQDGVPTTEVIEDLSGDDDETVSRIESAGFSRDGLQFAVRIRSKATRGWDVATGKEILASDSLTVPEWIFPTDPGHTLLAARTQGGVNVWDSRKAPTPLKLSHDASDLHFFASRNGARMATVASADVRLWEADSGRQLGSFKGHANVQDMAFSPDGAHVAAITWGPSAPIVAVQTGETRAQVTHDAGATDAENGIGQVEFSADSKLLVTAGNDRTARVWDVASGRELARMVHGSSVSVALFSSDGRHVTTWSDDNSVHVWMWRDADLIERACARLTRNLTEDEWRAYFGTASYAKTCPGLP